MRAEAHRQKMQEHLFKAEQNLVKAYKNMWLTRTEMVPGQVLRRLSTGQRAVITRLLFRNGRGQPKKFPSIFVCNIKKNGEQSILENRITTVNDWIVCHGEKIKLQKEQA